VRDTKATTGRGDEYDGETKRENAGSGTIFRFTQYISYSSFKSVKHSGKKAATRESYDDYYEVPLKIWLFTYES